MRNMLFALLGVGVLALGGYAAASTLDDTVPARTISLPGGTTGGTTTGETTAGETTTGETTTLQTTTPGTTTTGDGADDVSGPCDEAEHANDPRCTGGTVTDDRDDAHDDDNSGRGRGEDDDNDNDEDRSGSNSGRG